VAEGTEDITEAIVALLRQALPQHVLAGYMRYQKIRTIGSGGKAEVFLCRDQILGRELLSSDHEQHMLVREARIMAALSHPGIPKIHDLGRDFEGRPYFAMSYIEGGTLRELLGTQQQGITKTQQQFELQRRTTVLLEVATLLEDAHAMHVVHGDLKPDNILIDNSERVHLIDWGLASVLHEADDTENGEANFASERGCQGSPLYMSPEQAAHGSPLNTSTDIFSLGVLLYECLTFQTPFQGTDVDEVIAQILHAEPLPPSQVAPACTIPGDLERICLRALSKFPENRQASISEFAAELRDCQLDLLIEYDRAASTECGPAVAASNTWYDEPQLAYV
jgi:eukaryotic-like serine/threonine-protein kinase